MTTVTQVFRGKVVAVDKSQRTVVIQPQKKVNGKWEDDKSKPQVTRKW